MIKNCSHCGHPFETQYTFQKYCCSYCYRGANTRHNDRRGDTLYSDERRLDSFVEHIHKVEDGELEEDEYGW